MKRIPILFSLLFIINAFTAQKSIVKKTVYIILGSTREGRSSDKVGLAIKNIIEPNTDINFEIVDLRNWDIPFFHDAITPAEAQSKDPKIQAWSNKIKQAQGFIIITPTYNGSYTAVLKNALDVLYAEWNNKPVMFVGYSGGKSGGKKAIGHLRIVAKELKMKSLESEINIPRIWQAFDSKGEFKDQDIVAKIKTTISELLHGLK